MLTRNSIEQILKVLKHTKFNYDQGESLQASYQDAVQKVSKEYGVSYQTIGDACVRRLRQDDVHQFHQLVMDWLKGNPNALGSQIKHNSQVQYHKEIDDVLIKGNEKADQVQNVNSSNEESENITISIDGNSIKYLKALATIKGIEVKNVLSSIIKNAIAVEFKKVADSM